MKINIFTRIALIWGTVAAMAALSVTAGAQTTKKISATKASDNGIIYSLPSTALKVTVEVEKVVKQPGEFARYARKYLNINPEMTPSTQYNLKSVTLNAEGVTVDNEERYLVQFKSGATPYMILTDDNIPLGINIDEESVTASVVRNPIPVAVAAQPTILQQPVARQVVTEEMIQAQSTAKRAELAAAKIYELRQSRNDIISGDADNMPSDGKAMQLALDNLAAQEAALTAMFAGTEQHSTEVRTFTIIPEDEDSRTIVCRISATRGIVDDTDLSGDPLWVDVKVVSRGEIPLAESGEKRKFPKGGLAYRIPGNASVDVIYMDNVVCSLQLPMAQLGTVFGVEPGLFVDKKAPAYARFDPTTGSITELGTR